MIDASLVLQMVVAVLGAIALYTFIGFIPGTDETSVLVPVTLTLVLAGTPPMVVLAFFIAAIVTLNLMNAIPTALVGLPGGVMSAPMMEHSLDLRARGLAAVTIRKMAAGSVIGTVVSIPLAFLLAQAIAPWGEQLQEQGPLLLAVGAVVLALLGRNRVLALVTIIPLALLFQGIVGVYHDLGVLPAEKSVPFSFFLGITVGPMLVVLLSMLNRDLRAKLPRGDRTVVPLDRAGFERQSLLPSRLVTAGEGWWSAGAAAASTPLFFLSPVGLTFLLGEAAAKTAPAVGSARPERAVTVMSALAHSTYLAGVIIPLIALGVPLSPVAVGPANALFAEGHNLHDLLSVPEFAVATVLGAVVALVCSYVIAVRWSSRITRFVMTSVPHEAVVALFVGLILFLSYSEAGLVGVFGVVLIGIVCGTLNRMGVSYGVQFMTLYASTWIVGSLL